MTMIVEIHPLKASITFARRSLAVLNGWCSVAVDRRTTRREFVKLLSDPKRMELEPVGNLTEIKKHLRYTLLWTVAGSVVFMVGFVTVNLLNN